MDALTALKLFNMVVWLGLSVFLWAKGSDKVAAWATLVIAHIWIAA